MTTQTKTRLFPKAAAALAAEREKTRRDALVREAESCIAFLQYANSLGRKWGITLDAENMGESHLPNDPRPSDYQWMLFEFEDVHIRIRRFFSDNGATSSFYTDAVNPETGEDKCGIHSMAELGETMEHWAKKRDAS